MKISRLKRSKLSRSHNFELNSVSMHSLFRKTNTLLYTNEKLVFVDSDDLGRLEKESWKKIQNGCYESKQKSPFKQMIPEEITTGPGEH